MTPDSQDQVLYVKLVATEITPLPDLTPLTIVKVKEPATGGTPAIETVQTTKTPAYNAEEVGWQYIEDTQTPEAPVTVHQWSDVPATGTPGNTPVTLHIGICKVTGVQLASC